MINRIGEDYLKSQKVSEVFNPGRRYIQPSVDVTKDPGKIRGIGEKSVTPLPQGRTVRQNQERGSVETQEHHYFRQATGMGTRETPSKTASKTAPKTPLFDQKDRIQMSLEGNEELKRQNENEYDAFRYKNPINMTAFCENLGLSENLHQTPRSDSLANRLEAISMRTTGMGW